MTASNKLNKLIGYVVEWKRDTQITASWFNIPLIYLSSATLVYQNVRTLRDMFPSYWNYLLTSMGIFVLFYWVMAKVILRLEVYSAEVIYGQKINPYAINQFTPKERTIIEMSVRHTEGVIQTIKKICPENEELLKQLLESKMAVEKLLSGSG